MVLKVSFCVVHEHKHFVSDIALLPCETTAKLFLSEGSLDNKLSSACGKKSFLSLRTKYFQLLALIIQQTRAMPIYGQEAIVIRHPYITDILRYT